jgi:apolipoprotein N-acyltransferase
MREARAGTGAVPTRRERSIPGWQAPVIAFALGLLHAACFAPWGNWWTQLLVLAAFAGLLRAMALRGRPLAAIALAGGAFGFGWFVAGVGWLFVSMHTYGMMAAPLALLALVLLAIYLGLFPAAAAWASAGLWSRIRGAPSRPTLFATALFPVLFAAAFTLGDLGRGYLFTGFPWIAVGYAQVDGPLAGFAPVAGSYGVGFAACLLAGFAATAVADAVGARLRATAAAVLAALLLAGAGQALRQVTWSEPAGGPLAVRLLQGNVPQQMKFDPEVARQAMQRYLELTQAEPADLVVLPETAWTVPWSSTPADIARRLERFVEATGSAVAIGLPMPAVSSRGVPTLSNSVLLFDRGGAASGSLQPSARYDKRHLVPFGEFVPSGFRWFVDLMTIPLGDFGRGGPDQPPFRVKDQRIAFNICYEDAFGEELLPSLRGADGATVLANVSNIAWFGDSHALPQHLQIARMRALETARPMIRATNTGVTAAIDFDGRVMARLPTYRLGALAATVQGRSGLTPYARTGNWPVCLLALLVLAAGAVGARKPARIAP